MWSNVYNSIHTIYLQLALNVHIHNQLLIQTIKFPITNILFQPHLLMSIRLWSTVDDVLIIFRCAQCTCNPFTIYPFWPKTNEDQPIPSTSSADNNHQTSRGIFASIDGWSDMLLNSSALAFAYHARSWLVCFHRQPFRTSCLAQVTSRDNGGKMRLGFGVAIDRVLLDRNTTVDRRRIAVMAACVRPFNDGGEVAS